MFSLHKIPVSVLFIFLSFQVSGRDPFFPAAGAAESGMGFSCVMGPGFWSAFHNQALLPHQKSAAVGFNYQNRFGISELGTRSAGFVMPAGNAVIGAVYSHFGYRDLTRHSAGLACGLKLSEKVSAGIQTDYLSEKTAGDYNERRSLSFEAGLLINPSEKVSIGIHLFNPVPNSLRKSYLPSSLRAGAGIWLNSSLFACAEVEMSAGSNIDLKAGFEYQASESFRIRGGFSSENTSFSFGIGYLLKSVQIDLGFSTHEMLGVTSSASIIFRLK